MSRDREEKMTCWACRKEIKEEFYHISLQPISKPQHTKTGRIMLMYNTGKIAQYICSNCAAVIKRIL